MKTMEYEVKVSGISETRAVAWLAMAQAVAEYLGCELGGNVSDGMILDTRTSDRAMSKALAFRFWDALTSADRLAVVEYHEARHE